MRTPAHVVYDIVPATGLPPTAAGGRQQAARRSVRQPGTEILAEVIDGDADGGGRNLRCGNG